MVPDVTVNQLTEEAAALRIQLAKLDSHEAGIRSMLDEVRAEIGRRNLECQQRTLNVLQSKYKGTWPAKKAAAINAIIEGVLSKVVGVDTANPEPVSLLHFVQGELGPDLQGAFDKACREARAAARTEVVKDERMG